MKKIILASASPRRIEMMKDNGFDPEIIPAHVDEKLPFAMTPEASAMYLALKKASCAAELYENTDTDENDDILVIGADTIVVDDDKIIGKPKNADEAFDILSRLRSRHHHVITGVCIITVDKESCRKICFYDKTRVFFRDYSDEEMTRYICTSEPYDKAGGYAIQGTFGKYVDHIEGNLDNVIGFPLKLIKTYIENWI